MSETGSRHEGIVQAVEEVFSQAAGHLFQGAAREGCLRLWRDFAAQIDLASTRKPEAWAAALTYVYERLRMSWVSQDGVADAFGVTGATISHKYREMAETLGLVLLDGRYVPEAMRARIQREAGPFPEDLPLLEAPSGPRGWRPPVEQIEAFQDWLEERDQGPLRRAQDLVYEGWERLDDVESAERCFRDALQLDPTLADAHTGLGQIAEEHGHLEQAEAHYRRAYELAREALGTESPSAFHWWGELETRPYMRARQGLGWIYWITGRFREAIGEYEALLALNPNDNQGARYVIGPLYQLAGDLEGALRAYKAYEQNYPSEIGDPHHLFCWGLALYDAARRPEAVAKWRRACFENVYIPPLLLDEDDPEGEIWLFSNLEWPEYAEEYFVLYGELWERSPDALECLRRLWHDPEMRQDLERWLEVGRRLEALAPQVRTERRAADRAEWITLLETQGEIEERGPSEALLQRVLADEGKRGKRRRRSR
jgi:tetratricopeptide (TPR) repeat protein